MILPINRGIQFNPNGLQSKEWAIFSSREATRENQINEINTEKRSTLGGWGSLGVIGKLQHCSSS
jgi:hypothetical protein